MEHFELLYTIAAFYYRDSLTQQEIADRLNISRPTVSRALSKAQSLGIVRIELIPPAGFSELEISLARKMNLKRVVVASPGDGDAAERENRTRNIAECAGKLLFDIIRPDMSVGIGWGVTVYKTALALQSSAESTNAVFVPLVGSAGRNESHYQVNVIVDRVARQFNGKAMFFNIPAFVKNQQMMEYVLGDPQLRAIQEVWHHLDVAIIGLGAFGGTPSFPVGEYTLEALEELRSKKVVGDILGRFFNTEGFISKRALGETYITKDMPNMAEQVYLGIPVDALRKAKNIICLSGGAQKVRAIITAAKLGLFDFLVTDSMTARELMGALGRN